MANNLTDAQVDLIARRLSETIGRNGSGPTILAGPIPTDVDLRDGVFATIDDAVEASGIAFERLRSQSLDQRRTIIAAMRAEMVLQAENLARLAHDETGYGRFEDKVKKNLLVTHKTPGTEDLEPQAASGDHGLMLCEPAPFGVIGTITPVTNASSTIICNAIGMLAAGNSAVFNAHPGARRVGAATIQALNNAITAAGGPANLVSCVADPTIESAQTLMHHPGIRLLVVTGGPAVVKAAMNSGKRAICAGPGNPPVVVDETADIEQAGRDIVLGASFDNNIICVDEKETIVVDTVADALLDSMARQGATVLNRAEVRRLETVVFDGVTTPGKPGTANRELIGKNASVILGRIGITAGPEVRLVVAEVEADHPLVWTEQMMPVMPVVRVRDANAAIDLAVRAERGNRHTAGMYSKHLDNLSRMAREADCSIFVKNAPHYAGLAEGGEGHTSFTIASPTGEGLTSPRSFSRLRRCSLVDHFRIV